MNAYVNDSELNWEYRSKLKEAGKKNNVSLICVHGQSEIKRNEETNILARKNTRTPLTGLDPFHGIGKNKYMKEFCRKRKPKQKHFGTITQG